MSVFTSKRTSLSTQSGAGKSRRSVRFQINYNLKSVLTDFENEKEQQNYTELVCNIRDAGLGLRDDDLLQILTEARGCINILGKSHHLFVQVLLVVKWAHRSADIAEAYHGFVLDLCSAHNYFTKFAIEQLVDNFKPVAAFSEWVEGRPCEEEEVCYQRVHSLLKVLLQVIPMGLELLMSCLVDKFPYARSKDPSGHNAYVTNVLRVLDYRPELRQRILSLIITKLLALDVNAPRSELEANADDAEMFPMEDSVEMSNPVANTLDLTLDTMYRFINSQCHHNNTISWPRTKAFYADMSAVFDKVILPTHATHHVQFLMFYLLKFKNNLLCSFLQNLWRKVIDPNVFHVIRQAAIGYTASLLSRAKYVPISAVKDSLTQLSSWIHGYIANCDSQQNWDPRTHNVFYAACQALFYLIAFRHKEIAMNSPKGLAFLQGLHLAKIVGCQLNPLRVCAPAVTQNFAAVARHYQLAYCYSIIEHNRRNAIPVVYKDPTGAQIDTPTQVYLETFFPFDPYSLKRTKKYISDIYREYDGSLPEESCHRYGEGGSERDGDDEDDFLMDQSPVSSTMFSYGTSPGFKQT